MRSNDALDLYQQFHLKHLLHVPYIVRHYILDVPIRSAPKFVFLIPFFSPLPHQFSCLATGPKTLEQILHIVFFIVCPPLMDHLFTWKIKGNINTLQTKQLIYWTQLTSLQLLNLQLSMILTIFCIIPLSDNCPVLPWMWEERHHPHGPPPALEHWDGCSLQVTGPLKSCDWSSCPAHLVSPELSSQQLQYSRFIRGSIFIKL